MIPFVSICQSLRYVHTVSGTGNQIKLSHLRNVHEQCTNSGLAEVIQK